MPPWQACRVPSPASSLARTGISRRAVLLGAALPVGLVTLGSLTSCGGGEATPEAIEIAPTEPEAPEENLLDELSLIGAYLGAIEAHPELRGSLTSLADQHRAHARELGASQEELSAIVPITPAAAKVKATLTELIARERAAADLRAQSAQLDPAGERVRTLTFIAASESSHIPELRDIRGNT